MKRTYIYLWLAVLCILLAGCKDDPATGEYETEKVPFPEADWDGEKRADIFYEIFVRSFADTDGDGIGDLNGVTEKLDYLNELGVSGIWLMPINPSPSYHGYDVEDYTSINPDYGTMEDFDRMLAKAKSLGIKVILDFVINHTSKTHPWFEDAVLSVDSEYRDYYLFSQDPKADIEAGKIPMTDYYNSGEWHSVTTGTTGYKYMGMFSDWMPELNYHDIDDVANSPAYAAICEAGKFWLEKGVDGFRLDAVKHIYQNENSNENPRFLKMFYDQMSKTTPGVYMIGEVLSEAEYVAPYYAGLPALFDFSSWWRLEWALNNDSGKWYPKDLLDYEAMYARYRSDYINATKLSNHDEERTGSVLGGNVNKMKMAAKVLLTVSGSPYIYYGEEIGMLGLKPDEYVREPFLWNATSSDIYRTKWLTPMYSTDANVSNLTVQQSDPNSLYNVYKEFIELRNGDPVMAYGAMQLPDGYDEAAQDDKQVMAFYRVYNGTKYLVLHNLSSSQASYTINSEVKRGVLEHGDATVTRYGPTRYIANLPAYGTVICEL
ncbi:MAG: alpha-amylase [Alistipes sp.]|nr:alpha-amylase [Alistipes sp.]